MNASLRRDAALLNGKVCGNGILAPGPGHHRGDRSLHLTPCPSHRNGTGYLLHSFASDDPIECLDHVRQCLGLEAFMPGKEPRGKEVPSQSVPQPPEDPIETREDYAMHELRQLHFKLSDKDRCDAQRHLRQVRWAFREIDLRHELHRIVRNINGRAA